MKYKLYDENSDIKDKRNIVNQIIKNRGIDDCVYLNLNKSILLDPMLLNNMEDGIKLYEYHTSKRNKIAVIPDEDVDGFCSSAIIYKYTKNVFGSDYPITYIMHKRAKAHGITDDIEIPDDIKLLIVPDAGTNDKEQINNLLHNGIDILILDHHELEETYSKEDLNYKEHKAIIINNQMSQRYSNKNLCGAGIVYKFLKAFDDYSWNDNADEYLDLVALANISDNMDVCEYETKYLISVGLKNIKNKLLTGLIKSQEYSMNNNINIHSIQWNITPIINGMVRVGAYDEKELMFKAFIEQDEFFEYKKRGTKDKPEETIEESIYDRVPRLCKNAKSRQDKLKEKGVIAINDYLKEYPKENKLIVVDTTDILDSGLSGLVAIKIAEIYNKPCLLLNKFYNDKYEKEMYGGSARNIDFSPIDSLKDIVNMSSYCCGKGHKNAFGIVDLDVNNLQNAINEFNNILCDVNYEYVYRIDYKADVEDIDIQIVNEITKTSDMVGTGFEEPMILIENIYMNKNDFNIVGKNEDTIKYVYNDITYIMYKCNEGNQLYDFLQDAWSDDDCVTFNVIAKAEWNEYEGIKTPQFKIVDLEVTNTSVSDCADDEEDVW